MASEKYGEIGERRFSSSLLLDLALSGCDEIIEMDLAQGLLHNVRHAEGKYFVPIARGSLRDIIAFSANNMIHPDDREVYLRDNEVDTLLDRLAQTENGTIRTRVRYKLLDGGWRWVERVVVDGRRQGLPDGVVITFVFDIEQRTEPLRPPTVGEAAASRSEMTGLLRGEGFFERARETVKKAPPGWSILAIDLEQFKLFNEWYGREQGDLLLARIGAELSRIEQERGCLAGYLGQDDFMLLSPLGMDEIRELYATIHGLVMEFGNSVGFMPAFGIAQAEPGHSAEELYDRAAVAARHAKEDYHSRIRVFEPAMYRQTERDYQILSDFQKALRDHELFIMLQPQCKIRTKRVVGAESLVRWRKLNGEMISPGVFVPVLEKYGFVTDLDKYVWEEVCAWQKRWLESGHTSLPVSVNVSQIDIYTIDVPAYFEGLLKKYDLSVDLIKIEITESAYVDNGTVADTVRRLRERGFVVLMDDFGSGYSSLNMLRNLNVDIIKLDAQFLRMSGDDTKGIHIMESIVSMAKTMGVPIIVEGVETKEETEFLTGLGCRYVQGYYFYRPMSVEDFEKLIADPRQIDTRGFWFKVKEQFHLREFLDRNMFSDVVLNNILGPVAFFSRRGEDVDIVRYNQQFQAETRLPNLARHTKKIQRHVFSEDAPQFYALLDQAVKDPLGGADGVVRFNLADDSVAQVRLHFYFLGSDEHGQRFYGSLRDITNYVTPNDQMRLLSMLIPNSVIFLRRDETGLRFQVVVHGLRKEMGLSREALERELDSGRFRERLDSAEREALVQRIVDSGMRMREFSKPFRVAVPDGEIRLCMRFDRVHDKSSGVDYILILRRDVE